MLCTISSLAVQTVIQVLDGIKTGHLQIKLQDSTCLRRRENWQHHSLWISCSAIAVQLSVNSEKCCFKVTFLIPNPVTATRMFRCCFRHKQVFNSSHVNLRPSYLSHHSWMWNNHWYLQGEDWSRSEHCWRSRHFAGWLEKYVCHSSEITVMKLKSDRRDFFVICFYSIYQKTQKKQK